MENIEFSIRGIWSLTLIQSSNVFCSHQGRASRQSPVGGWTRGWPSRRLGDTGRSGWRSSTGFVAWDSIFQCFNIITFQYFNILIFQYLVFGFQKMRSAMSRLEKPSSIVSGGKVQIISCNDYNDDDLVELVRDLTLFWWWRWCRGKVPGNTRRLLHCALQASLKKKMNVIIIPIIIIVIIMIIVITIIIVLTTFLLIMIVFTGKPQGGR